MTDPTVRILLGESFDALKAELLQSYVNFCWRLAHLAVAIHVDGDAFTVRFTEDGPVIEDVSASTDARIETSVRCILAVIDGAIELSEAVMQDEVRVIGALSVVARLDEGILAYVHGAVRCPSFPKLLDRLRSLSRSTETGGHL